MQEGYITLIKLLQKKDMLLENLIQVFTIKTFIIIEDYNAHNKTLPFI